MEEVKRRIGQTGISLLPSKFLVPEIGHAPET